MSDVTIDIEEYFLNCKILVVDDAEFSRCFIAEVFKNNGFLNIDVAEDGQEAIDKTYQNHPDIVLLDLIMPNVDGFEYLEAIRADPEFENLPVLVQSAATSVDHMSRAFKIGATDFVNKPINADEIIARSKVHLERKKLMEDLRLYRKRVASELDAARQMQDSIMPTRKLCDEIENQYELDIAAHFEPSSEIGGDFWGVKKIAADKLAIYNVDVSGHGVSAAINTFRLHTLLSEDHNYFSDPSACLEKLNQRMYDLLPVGQFATMFYGIIDTTNDALIYASASAPEAIVVRKNGDVVKLGAAGLPVAAISNASYDLLSVPFDKGDLLCLYSDALIESENEKGEFFTEIDVVNSIKKRDGSNGRKVFSSAILESIIYDFKEHVVGELDDDLTLCVYLRKC